MMGLVTPPTPMEATELIRQLQMAVKNYGDFEITGEDESNCNDAIQGNTYPIRFRLVSTPGEYEDLPGISFEGGFPIEKNHRKFLGVIFIDR